MSGTISPFTATVATIGTLLLGGVFAAIINANVIGWLLSQVAALAIGWFCRHRLVARLGGISGDVFGALIELSTMLVLVGMSLS